MAFTMKLIEISRTTECLVKQNAAQHSVHPTSGSRRDLQAFSWLQVFLLPSLISSRPLAANANRWAAVAR